MRVLATALAGAVLAGCASGGPPTIQMGPDAEVTVEGLHRVNNSRAAIAYMKPDIDLAPYTKIMLDPVMVSYRKDPQGRRRAAGMGGGETNFALSDRQMEDLKAWFNEAVVEALTENDGYEIVTAPGPDVLRVTAELMDLEVRIPTDRPGGRGGMAVRSYGEVTLVVDLRDSQSGEILARAGDRRDPTRNTDMSLARVETVFVKADTERLFNYWADLMRERLDELRGLEVS